MSDFNPYEQPEAELLTADLSELDIHEGVHRPVSHAVQWVADGWTIFSRQWVVWSVAVFLNLLVSTAAGLIPLLGFILQMLIAPVLTAGLLYMASRADKGERISVGDLFQGFQDGPGKLMLFGLAMFVMILMAMIVTGLIAVLVFGLDMAVMMQAAGGQVPEALDPNMMIMKFLLLFCVYMLLIIPVMAAYWFGLPLVYFGGVGIFSALKHSIIICIRNFFSLFVYGLLLMLVFAGMAVLVGIAGALLAVASQGLGVFVGVILGLGMMFAMMAVMMCSWYASFRDIFITP